LSLAFISKSGKFARIAAKSITYVAKVPFNLCYTILHEFRLIVTAAYSSFMHGNHSSNNEKQEIFINSYVDNYNTCAYSRIENHIGLSKPYV